MANLRNRSSLLDRATFLALTLGASAFCFANQITVSGNFHYDRSEYVGAGTSFWFSYTGMETPALVGNTPVRGIGAGCLVLCTGENTYFSTSAIFGLDLDFALNSDFVAGSVPISISLGAPSTILPGTMFKVGAGGFGFRNGSLATTESTVQAYADFFLSLAAGVYGDACGGMSCSTFGEGPRQAQPPARVPSRSAGRSRRLGHSRGKLS